MKAVNNYVVIDKIKEPEKKVAGLILTENVNDEVRYFKANVVSAGEKAEGISDGDVIWYDRHAGHGVEYGDKLYFVIRASDIVLVD